uniref:Uncharacterized protein n=1 Tax=Anguilla anguilla TaxID=7936 RepID=A0A0E9QCD0_ANGAN
MFTTTTKKINALENCAAFFKGIWSLLFVTPSQKFHCVTTNLFTFSLSTALEKIETNFQFHSLYMYCMCLCKM